MSLTTAATARLQSNIENVIIGKSDVIENTIITLIAGGHLLIEDVPGVGKSSLAFALAKSLGLEFRRIQFTNDILPSDIVGVSIYNQNENTFEFNRGPIFANLVLADEINRSSPRTQSALLEAMNEKQVSVDNRTYDLEDPFMVIATQNPIESHGAHPLPESQLDRFMMYLSMGYPDPEEERKLLGTQSPSRNIKDVKAILSREDVLNLQKQAEAVTMEPVLIDYIMNVVTATRESKHLSLGVSPRGGLILQQAARARALVHGRTYCIPDDIKQLAIPVLCHRVIPQNHHGMNKRTAADTSAVIMEIVDKMEIPV
ncbi:ATPase, AAA family; putative Methanol dehydrogenase regulatory protein MoxR [Nitrospina gracilis 3/211]|uniref:ATPase, AAA family putative Methanol dehydrogenase regulatory protein MoxR n=1 Tax=Nitrospina gracilis (strain 3/211) TaxID=1266370 RepID=M1Z1H0_NITG3|nr:MULTISPECIES: MoxR family ATPase [Nitrospina]MCF8724208.1 MoxR-like ATPase [Nitrospina sp. Nb-3]CCQ91355.1 ATPase, AAA family; putative Methanol dehydrogenase regulatory protein MoxR [Nitrospina gracilis 3/211]